jgi:tripartite ATP-independent transporter DctM subunit
MEIQETLVVMMFLVTFGSLLAGFPVAFTLSGTALLFGFGAYAFGFFDASFLGAMPQRIFGSAMTNEILVAVPLFVFMGVMLERSKVAEELLESMGMMFGRLRGGLGISVFIVGALLAASTGIVGATVVTMGLLALPTMLRRGYDPALAAGSISASGTLGQIIPPSIVLVVLGDQISNAYVEAQRAIGNWSPEPVSVGDLFAGALLPGLLLVGLYILYQLAMALLKPESSPAMPRELDERAGPALWWRLMQSLVPPIVLIVAVLGSILAGVATPTEAAAVGAVGALLLAGVRLDRAHAAPMYIAGACLIGMLILSAVFDLRLARTKIPVDDQIAIYIAELFTLGLVWGLVVSLMRVYRTKILHDVMRTAMQVSAMVFAILIGAALFSLVFRGLGGDVIVHEFLSELPGGAMSAMAVVMLVIFFMGFFIDWIEISFVVVPIVAPILLQFDIHPVWLGVMIAMNLQTSFLTPPFGFALFFLRGVAPPEVTTMHIYKGVAPFVLIQLVALALLAVYPGMATWLPSVIFG